MSTLKVDAINATGGTTGMALASNGIVTIQAAGTATTTLQQGLAKMWVRYDGSDPASGLDSLNLSSITDNTTGDQRPVYTNPMSSENYAPVITSSQYHELLGNAGGDTGTTTTTIKLETRNSSNSAADTGRCVTAIFGDLA